MSLCDDHRGGLGCGGKLMRKNKYLDQITPMELGMKLSICNHFPRLGSFQKPSVYFPFTCNIAILIERHSFRELTARRNPSIGK
jgi:hypothetical protein